MNMKTSIYQWLRLFGDKLMELVFAFAIVVILYTGVLYLVGFLWTTYIETPMGQRFLSLHMVEMALIESLQDRNFFMLSFQVSFIVIKVCLVVGAVGQLFFLIRYLYDGRGFFGHLILWGIPCAALATIAIYRTYEIGWMASFLLGLVPSVVLFNYCLKFTSELVPEIFIPFKGSRRPAQSRVEKDERSEPRYMIKLPVTYYGSKSRDIHRGVADQISCHGFCLLAPKVELTGNIIKFKLSVDKNPVLGKARINWIRHAKSVDSRKAPSSRSGCRIVSMAEKHENLLTSFLRKQSSAKA